MITHQNNALIPYEQSANYEWNHKNIQFLFRKIAYGIPPNDFPKYLKMSPTKIVHHLVEKAKKPTYSPAPKWGNWTIKNYQKLNGEIKDKLVEKHAVEWSTMAMKGMYEKGFKEKIVLFWANHFVTSFWNYSSPLMLRSYHQLLQKYAMGNFKDFVKAIGLNPAMLVYLNGVENTVEKPNENYARELLELFTLGRDEGYTQKDIKEIARAFSGYEVENWTKVVLNKEKQDKNDKIIFDKKGNWNYNDVIDLLFDERAELIAKFVCKKIYQAFVYHEPNDIVINQLAIVFIHNDFELAPVFRKLFASQHFFSEAIIGTQIKSPIDLLLIFMNELNVELNNHRQCQELYEYAYWTGQIVFSPPDVSGWKGQRHWIDATKMTRRWQVLEGVLYEFVGESNMRILIKLVKSLTKETQNPELITKAIVDYFTPKGLKSEIDYQKAYGKFIAEWPKDVFVNGWWNIDREDTEWQVAALITYLFRLPEFHLV